MDQATPGWTIYTKPFHKQALLWRHIWKVNGSPRTGHIADIRNRARSQYHNVVHYVKSHADAILANKMAESMLQQNSNSFWRNVKLVKSGKSALPTLIDDTHGNENISILFLEKYKKLYNSVPYNQRDMVTFQSETNSNKCMQGKCYSTHLVSVNDVTVGLRHVKHGKQDSRLGHCSDHIIFSCDLLALYLSFLFTLY